VLVVTDPPAVCHPQTIDLTAAGITTGSSAGLGFSYYTDAGGTSALANPSTVSTPGAYYIKGTGIVTGCETNILQVNTSFNFKPTLTTSRDTTVCKDGTAWLGAFSPGSTIQWTGLAAGDTVSVKPPESSFYQVIATNAAGCRDTAAVNVQVDIMSAFLNASPDITIPGSAISLSTTNNYQVVAWTPASMFANQTSRTQSITVADSSVQFSVVLKSTNGCLDTASVKVIVDPTSYDVFVPNAFTPNGDGKNDAFLVVGPSINEVELRIFNQWGQQIFASQDKTRGWTGLYNGVPQPAGVYIYTVKATLYNKTVITKRGTVLLIR
jgi:gliding motility-associated-like protein